MSFGMWTRVGPRNHVLDGVKIAVQRRSFEGKRRPIVKYSDTLSWVVQKRLNRSSCRLECRLGWTKERWYGVHIGATWRIRLNRPFAAAMRPYTLTTCCMCLLELDMGPTHPQVRMGWVGSYDFWTWLEDFCALICNRHGVWMGRDEKNWTEERGRVGRSSEFVIVITKDLFTSSTCRYTTLWNTSHLCDWQWRFRATLYMLYLRGHPVYVTFSFGL